MALRVFRGLLVLAGHHRHIRLFRVGTGAVRRGHVLHAARQHVLLRHGVRGGEFLAGIRRQAGDLPAVARQLILHLDARDGQVAIVGHGDLVGDFLAQGVLAVFGLRLAGGFLGDGQVALRVFRIIIRMTRIHRHIGLIRVGTGAVRRGVVNDMAGKDIRLGHLGTGFKALLLTGSKHSHLFLQAGALVGYGDILDGQVAVVDHLDFILDAVPQLEAAHRRLRLGGLRHCQVAIFRLGVHRGGGLLGDLAQLGRNSVGEAAGQDILFGDLVFRCGAALFAAGHGRELRILQGNARNLLQGDILLAVVDIGDFDGESYQIAGLVFLLLGGLGDHQAVLHLILVTGLGTVGHGQGAVDIFNRVTLGNIRAIGVQNLRIRGVVFAAAHQRLGAGHLHGINGVACGQLAFGQLIAVLGESGAVVHLGGAVRGDLNFDGLSLHRIFAGKGLITQLHGNGVGDLCGHHVCRGDNVPHGDVGLFAGRQGLRHMAHNYHAVRLAHFQGLYDIVDVLHIHHPDHGFAHAVFAVRAVALGDHPVIGHTHIRHGEVARLLLHFIVMQVGAVLGLDGEAVGALPHQRLAAGEGIGCAFAAHPTVLGLKERAAVYQRGAIIHFLQIIALQREGLWLDLQRAVGSRHCCVLVFVGQHIVILVLGIVVRIQHALDGSGVGQGNGVARGQFKHQAGGILRRYIFTVELHGVNGMAVDCAVVGPVLVTGGDLHRLGALGHGQGAEHRSDVVVPRQGFIVRRLEGVGEGVVLRRAAHLGLAAGDVVGGALTLHEAVAGHGHGIVGQGLAVVLLGIIGGGQGDAALGDGQRAVGSRHIGIGSIGNSHCSVCLVDVVIEFVLAVVRGDCRVGIGYVLHRCGVGNGDDVLRRQRKLEAIGAFHRRHVPAVIGDGINGLAVHFAIILPGLTVGLEHNRLGVCGYGQSAVHGSDVVVLLQGCIVCLLGGVGKDVVVRLAAHLGLAAVD